jgi:hypothetical protein
MRKIITAGAVSVAVLGGGLAAAVPALASTPAVHLVTVSPEHSDTTSASGTATESGPNGAIWASDQLKETITAKQEPNAGHYDVTIRVGGSTFHGFADPRNAGEAGSDGSTAGGPMLSQGAITGSIQYDNIASTSAPDASNVPATQAPNTSLGDVLSELFHGHNGAAATTSYSFTYTPSANSVDPTAATTPNAWTAGTAYNQAG